MSKQERKAMYETVLRRESTTALRKQQHDAHDGLQCKESRGFLLNDVVLHERL
jgi:hypothetical protein